MMYMNWRVQVSDGQGGESRLTLWSHPGSDTTGMLVRCEKVAGTAEKVLSLQRSSQSSGAV